MSSDSERHEEWASRDAGDSSYSLGTRGVEDGTPPSRRAAREAGRLSSRGEGLLGDALEDTVGDGERWHSSEESWRGSDHAGENPRCDGGLSDGWGEDRWGTDPLGRSSDASGEVRPAGLGVAGVSFAAFRPAGTPQDALPSVGTGADNTTSLQYSGELAAVSQTNPVGELPLPRNGDDARAGGARDGLARRRARHGTPDGAAHQWSPVTDGEEPNGSSDVSGSTEPGEPGESRSQRRDRLRHESAAEESSPVFEELRDGGRYRGRDELDAGTDSGRQDEATSFSEPAQGAHGSSYQGGHVGESQFGFGSAQGGSGDVAGGDRTADPAGAGGPQYSGQQRSSGQHSAPGQHDGPGQLAHAGQPGTAGIFGASLPGQESHPGQAGQHVQAGASGMMQHGPEGQPGQNGHGRLPQGGSGDGAYGRHNGGPGFGGQPGASDRDGAKSHLGDDLPGGGQVDSGMPGAGGQGEPFGQRQGGGVGQAGAGGQIFGYSQAGGQGPEFGGQFGGQGQSGGPGAGQGPGHAAAPGSSQVSGAVPAHGQASQHGGAVAQNGVAGPAGAGAQNGVGSLDAAQNGVGAHNAAAQGGVGGQAGPGAGGQAGAGAGHGDSGRGAGGAGQYAPGQLDMGAHRGMAPHPSQGGPSQGPVSASQGVPGQAGPAGTGQGGVGQVAPGQGGAFPAHAVGETTIAPPKEPARLPTVDRYESGQAGALVGSPVRQGPPSSVSQGAMTDAPGGQGVLSGPGVGGVLMAGLGAQPGSGAQSGPGLAGQEPAPVAAQPDAMRGGRNAGPRLDVHSLMSSVVSLGASDLHLTEGVPPMVRVRGELVPVQGHEKITADSIGSAAFGMMTQKQREVFEEDWELDYSYNLPQVGRFRVNVYRQQEKLGMVLRLIPYEIKSVTDLGLPESVASFAAYQRGLVLVTGTTGSGKSTTLAAVIDEANSTRSDHILTIEDPVEFIHQHKQCVVNQRQVGEDTRSFAKALRQALRQDPDVILVGEIRDMETTSVALTAAETGHLVLGTLHTQDAVQTIDRVIDVYPPEQQHQVRTMLAGALQAVMCQTLVVTADGRGRVPVYEIMIATPGIRNLIREGKTHQVYTAMQAGKQHGMITMDQCLAMRVREGLVSHERALEVCHNVEEFKRLVSRG